MRSDCRLSAIMERVKALFIGPGCPWENGSVESFNEKLRGEFLSGEVFRTLAEAQILMEWWRREYNQEKPHRALGYRPLAPKNKSPQDSHFDWSSFRGEDHRRYLVAWGLSNTLDVGLFAETLSEALERVRPEVFNTDQGSQAHQPEVHPSPSGSRGEDQHGW